MIDSKLIRQDILLVAERLSTRGIKVDVPCLTALEEQRKAYQVELQGHQNQRNLLSKTIGQLKANHQNTDELLKEMREINENLTMTEKKFEAIQAKLNDQLSRLPNLPHDSVPRGKSEADNVVIRTWGEPRKFNFKPKDHIEIGEKLGMDFASASALSGARFVVLKGKLARLQRALIQFMLNLHTEEHGYEEMYVPYLVHGEALYGTGQLPNLKEDLFKIAGEDDFYLIPTSEVSVTNTVRNQILNGEELPLKYVCHSPCFRSEAGSYGKDTRGMIRNHQFEKVELVQIVKPEDSYKAHEELTRHAEAVLQRLELPYRVVALCTGDLGFAAAKTYDLEVWLPSQGCYREISSCSNTEAFQARRMQARFREEGQGKDVQFVHTINGSGLAVGRTLVAILENHQKMNGKIDLPCDFEKN